MCIIDINRISLMDIDAIRMFTIIDYIYYNFKMIVQLLVLVYMPLPILYSSLSI